MLLQIFFRSILGDLLAKYHQMAKEREVALCVQNATHYILEVNETGDISQSDLYDLILDEREFVQIVKNLTVKEK